MPEAATYLSALRTGQLDYIGALSLTQLRTIDQLESLQRTNPEIKTYPFYFRSNDSFELDIRKPPFDDINVRHAMQLALNNETSAATLWSGQADPTPFGLIGNKGYYIPFDEWPAEVKQWYRYDPEAAEKLLDEAGYPRGADGVRFKVTHDHRYPNYDLGYAEIAAGYWTDIGVDVKIDVLDEASGSATRRNRTWEGLIFHLLGSNNPPLSEVRNMVHSSGTDLHGIRYPELDALIEAAEATTSEEEQQRLVKEVDMHTMENHWWIWGPKAGKYMAIQPWVEGYSGEVHFGGQHRLPILARLWIDQDLKKEMGF